MTGRNPNDLRVIGESAGGQVAVRGVIKNVRYRTTKVYSLAGTTELDYGYDRWEGHEIGRTIQRVT